MATRRTKFDFKKIAMNTLALSGGAAASGIVDGMLLSKVSTDPKIQGLIKIGAGALIPSFIGKGNEFIEKFGEGMVTIGGYQLLHAVLPGQIPAISGIGSQNLLAYPPRVEMNGLPTVSGGLPTLEGIGETEGDDFLE